MTTATVIYTRFSPRRNADECESCDIQEAQCHKYAAAKGWRVRSRHRDEAVSGKDVYRPGLDAAIADLRRGDVLLVVRQDRIARKVLLSEMVHHKVACKGARIEALHGGVSGDGPSAKVVRQVLAAVSEFEREQIAERTKYAMLSRQEGGQRVSRYAPYGYRVSECDPTRIIKDRKEQRAVERIQELASAGVTPCRIATKMNAEMPQVCRGKRWSPRTVEKIAGRAQ